MIEKNDPQTMEPEDFARLRILQDGRLSPDGQTMAYVVSHVDAGQDQDCFVIWLLSLETGESRQLTAGLADDTGPRWSPDGAQIAFLSNRGGKAQIYLIPVDGGEARALTAMPQGVGSGPVWSPDGAHIAFTAGPEAPPLDLTKPYRITRHVYRIDGMGYVDNSVKDIYLVSVDDGETRQLTNDALHNTSPVWSPDGSEILFNTSMWPDSDRREAALLVVNLAGEIRELLVDWGAGHTATWTPDGERVVFIGKPFGSLHGAQNNLWVMDSRGGEPECRTHDLPFHVGGFLQPDIPALGLVDAQTFVTSDGQYAFVQVQEGGTMPIYRIALNGPESCVPVVKSEERYCVPQDVNDEHVLFIVSTLNNPTDLYIADLDGSNERRLTHLNVDLLAERALPTTERLLYSSSDGAQIEGWIMKPPAGQAPYATILCIHGGPHFAYGHAFSFDFQMLCGAGYAVLFINQRASTGYGDGFATATYGDWGNLDYDDLMAGVDYVIEKGIADPDRLGVSGISYGGFMSCWIVGHTDRFKAAMPENPVTNWISSYGTCDIGTSTGPKEMGGRPHEVYDVYRRCSPITYAHRCTTPTLLIQGEADYRCPTEQSEQFYAALKVNGCPVEMLRIPHSPHEGTIGGPPAWRRAHNEALLDWMNRYVLGVESESQP